MAFKYGDKPRWQFGTLLALQLGCLPVYAEQVTERKTVEEVIPITVANLRGQQALYKEGWFIVTSTEETFRYAKEKSIDSTAQALQQAVVDIKKHFKEFGSGVVEGVESGVDTGKTVFTKGTQLSGGIVVGTHKLAQWQLETSGKGFVSAWDKFVLGNLSLVERTAEDRDALKAIPGNYFSDIKEDFNGLYELSNRLADNVTPDIEVSWSDSFENAQQAFTEEYEESGEASNSLSALGDIGVGYIKALYHGLIKPGAQTGAKGVSVTANVAGQAIFLPTAGVFILTGRTVQSAGLTLYYTTTTGIKLVSPTVESGLLAGLSLLNAATVPVTYTGGASVGLVNQVAVTVGAPVVGAAEAGAETLKESVKYAGLLTYDLAKGSSKVVFNQAASGIALGYNALTALPTQALLSTTNGAFFLVYDGPRLLIAKVSGELDSNDHYPVDDIPVGTVLDIKQLQAQPGVTVESVSEDPAVIEEVLRKMPEDLRQ